MCDGMQVYEVKVGDELMSKVHTSSAGVTKRGATQDCREYDFIDPTCVFWASGIDRVCPGIVAFLETTCTGFAVEGSCFSQWTYSRFLYGLYIQNCNGKQSEKIEHSAMTESMCVLCHQRLYSLVLYV